MTTKLTLLVEKSTVESAKVYAKKTGRSLSQLVESYLQKLTHGEGTESLSSKLQGLIGVVKLPEDFDEAQELRSYLEAKHL